MLDQKSEAFEDDQAQIFGTKRQKTRNYGRFSTQQHEKSDVSEVSSIKSQ